MYPNSPNTRLNLLRVDSFLDEVGNISLVLINKKEVIGINFSITQKEFYDSTRLESRVDLAVKIQSFLYDGSLYADVSDKIYKIERTYHNGGFVELYLRETKIKKSDIIGYS